MIHLFHENCCLGCSFAAVCCIVVPVYGQEKGSQPAPDKQSTANTPSQAGSSVKQNTAQTQSNGAVEQPTGYFHRLFSPENLPNIGLFVAGIVGIIVAVSTLKAIKGQLKEMQDSGKQAAQQLEVAQKSADAALLNAQAVINAERAWVVLELVETETHRHFRSVMTNYGRTPAQVIGYNIQRSGTMSISDLPADPLPYSESPAPQAQPFLVPNEESEIENFSLDANFWKLPNVAPQPILYWGVIRYRDSIGNTEHETWFCHCYDANKGMFVIAGPLTYNRYT